MGTIYTTTGGPAVPSFGGIPFPDIGLAGLVTLAVVSILMGWIVPRYVYREKIAEVQELRRTVQARDEELAEKNEHLRQLAHVSRIVEALATGLQREIDR